uniref:Cytoplasmic dynein 2 light intermediate chain 1 n=1 Tax=Periophthalmus magnuspinnatus TaxID=409849 RepID=A0A3B4AHE4_9GOBI
LSETLWDLAAADVQKLQSGVGEEERSAEPSERTVFLIGSKAGGKTSILYRCLDKDEPPKPTLALEYSFGRRTRGHNTFKDIAHLWELGGGVSLSDLVQIPISASNISSLSIILVLDLSKPNCLWGTMERLLQTAQEQTEKAQKTSSKQQSVQQTRVLPKDYPDRELINPFPVPLLIIGSKYDLFQEFESDKKKLISKTLRFIAHYYAASLIVSSSQNLNVQNQKQRQNATCLFVFRKTVSTESNKPLMIPAGADSFSQIGTPPTSDVTSLHAKNPRDLWKKVYESIFPQEVQNEQRELKDPAKDPQYSEPQVDTMRAQKDQELEQYKRNAAKSWKGLDLES